MRSSLVALGSAAVLAVYAAGYVRTRSAAQRFASEDRERRRPVPAPVVASPPPTDSAVRFDTVVKLAQATRVPSSSAAEPAPVDAPSGAPVVATSEPPPSTATRPSGSTATATMPAGAGADTGTRGVRKAVEGTRSKRTDTAAPVPAPVRVPAPAAESTVAAAPAGTTSSAGSLTSETALAAKPAAAGSSAVAVAGSTSSALPRSTDTSDAATTVIVAADSTAVPTDTAADSASQAVQAEPTLRDGTYLGWGSSRHGDIQAQVVIEGGRIVSASIAQCLTRYSCSWIAKLPPQVVERQSPEVDYVSGATQSTNAFYYAVVDALGKAK